MVSCLNTQETWALAHERSHPTRRAQIHRWLLHSLERCCSALSLKQYTVTVAPEYVAHSPRFYRKYKEERVSAFQRLPAPKQPVFNQPCRRIDLWTIYQNRGRRSSFYRVPCMCQVLFNFNWTFTVPYEGSSLPPINSRENEGSGTSANCPASHGEEIDEMRYQARFV